MTWNPLGFRDRPDDIRSRLPFVQNAPPPSPSPLVVDFTAPCPGCGTDVAWHASPGPGAELSVSRPPTYLIDCDCP